MRYDLIRKLRGLTASECGDLLRAQIALIAAQLLIWSRPRGRLVFRAGLGDRDRRGPQPTQPHAEQVAERLGLAVCRAAAHGLFRPPCLVRALALVRLLESRGIRGSTIHVGVCRSGNRLVAHAWVEYGALLLADQPGHVGGYAELTDMEVAPST